MFFIATRNRILRGLASLIVTVLLFGFSTHLGRAAVMQSSNYKIERDSINTGGALGESGSYSMEDSMGEVATGYSESATFKLHAGYQQLHEATLSLSGMTNVLLTPTLLPITGGTANGSTTANVYSDSSTGYELKIKAEYDPAMRQSATSSFANYTPAGVAPDYAFTVGTQAAEFGFSAYGVDIATRYKNNGSVCGVGSLVTDSTCWDPVTTSDVVIARRTSQTGIAGIATKINFRAVVAPNANPAEGTYIATTTVTLVAI